MAMKINRGILLVLATAIISGISIFMNAYAVKGFDSSVFTFSKNIVVAVLLAAIIVGFNQFSSLKQLSKKQWLQLVAIGLIGGSIPFLLFFKGLQLASGTTASFLHKTLFIWVTVLSVLALKEKPTKGLVFGAALLLAGNYLLIKPAFTFSLGHLFIIGAVLLWAIENVYAKHVLEKTTGTVVAFGRMFFGSIFIFAFLLLTNKTQIIVSMSGAQYLWVLVTAAFLFLYVLTYYSGLKLVSASTAASVLVLGSTVTIALDYALRGIMITASIALGSLITLAGVVLVLWYPFLATKLRTVFKRSNFEA